MNGIPGWNSLTPVETMGEKSPFPGSISEFDDAISQYGNAAEDAYYQIVRNRDAEKLEKKRIREQQAYIARQKRMLAERARKKLKVPPETAGNIENAQEQIRESEEVLKLLPAHRDAWAKELAHRKDLLKTLRTERRKGLDSKGEPRKCNSRNTADGKPCQNTKHYRRGQGWGPCTLPNH